MPSNRIRKAAEDLTLKDLEQSPLWEHALDEEGLADQDETTMRPIEADIIATDFYGWVATDFTAPGGERWLGVMYPPKTPHDLWTADPEIFLPRPAGELAKFTVEQSYNSIVTPGSARIGFTLARRTAQPDLEVLPLIEIVHQVLNVPRANLFPLSLRPRVPIKNGPPDFSLKGFPRPPNTSGHIEYLQ